MRLSPVQSSISWSLPLKHHGEHGERQVTPNLRLDQCLIESAQPPARPSCIIRIQYREVKPTTRLGVLGLRRFNPPVLRRTALPARVWRCKERSAARNFFAKQELSETG